MNILNFNRFKGLAKILNMDIFLVVIGLLCVLVGILGSFLPVLPGLPISWLGLLFVHLTSVVSINYTFLGIWLAVAVIILLLDYIIPAMGTKKFGGSKYGVYGTTLGLIAGMFFPPLGFVIGPFVGAYVGEMLYQQNSKVAAKAAWGAFVGFLASSFMKFIMSLVFVGLYFYEVIGNFKGLFPFFYN